MRKSSVIIPAVLASALAFAAFERVAQADSFTYDLAERVTESISGSVTTTYAYDALGSIVRRCTNGACTDLVTTPDGEPTVIAQVDVASERATLYAPGSSRTEAFRLPTGASFYLLNDAVGSPVGSLESASGSVSVEAFDAFGQRRAQGSAAEAAVGYTGENSSPDDPVLWLRARSYLPANGRFLQRDSYVGSSGDPSSMQRFGYAHGDPISNTDPSGHWIAPALAIAGALLGALYDVLQSPEVARAPQPRRCSDTDPEEQANIERFEREQAISDLNGVVKQFGRNPRSMAGGLIGDVASKALRRALPVGRPGGAMVPYRDALQHRAIPYLGRGKSLYGFDENLPIGGRIKGIANAIGDAEMNFGTGNLSRFPAQAAARTYGRSSTLHVGPTPSQQWSVDANFAFVDTLAKRASVGETELIHLARPDMMGGTAYNASKLGNGFVMPGSPFPSITSNEIRQVEVSHGLRPAGDDYLQIFRRH